MKPTITQETYLGRKTGFLATLAGWEGRGKTRQDAEADLEAQLRHVAENIHAFRVIRIPGCTFILRALPRGWEYTIVRDDSPDKPGSCLMGGTFAEALAAMQRHADQMRDSV